MHKTWLVTLLIALPFLRVFSSPSISRTSAKGFAVALQELNRGIQRILIQEEEEAISLSLDKEFGYAWGSEIQGTFTLQAHGPEELHRVVFLIDGEPIAEDGESPFAVQFNTGGYSLGEHNLQAIGFTQAGRELRSNPVRFDFVSPEQGWQAALRIALPILIVVFGAMLLSFVIPIFLGRGRTKDLPRGAPRSYGILGGAICPKCNRPFGMHLFGLNLAVGKLDRCPYCGRWSLVRRASPAELSAAEAAELREDRGAPDLPSLSAEERLLQDLDRSRYEDL